MLLDKKYRIVVKRVNKLQHKLCSNKQKCSERELSEFLSLCHIIYCKERRGRLLNRIYLLLNQLVFQRLIESVREEKKQVNILLEQISSGDHLQMGSS